MDNKSKKIQAFEYVVKCLIDWYESQSNKEDALSYFDKIKILKLHFFVSAINATEKDSNLLATFDNFYAMPYGHVESSIYDGLSETKVYWITNENLKLKEGAPEDYFDTIDQKIKNEIDSSIEALRFINSDIINCQSFKLVEISHKWQSWITVYNLAQMLDKRSMQIPTDLIKKETKIFS